MRVLRFVPWLAAHGPEPGELGAYLGQSQAELAGGCQAILEGNVLVEAVAGKRAAAEHVREDARQYPQPIPGVGHDRVVDQVGRATVLDLLDQVPEEQGRHAGVTVVEEAVAMAEPHVEHWREGGFDVRGVREVELERLRLEESVEATLELGADLGEAGIPLGERGDVVAVLPCVQGLLAQERVGFRRHGGIGDAGYRLARRRDQVGLERWPDETQDVAGEPEQRIGPIPLERRVVVEPERHVADLRMGHRLLVGSRKSIRCDHPPRSTCPGRAPVCRPLSNRPAPFTSMPTYPSASTTYRSVPPGKSRTRRACPARSRLRSMSRMSAQALSRRKPRPSSAWIVAGIPVKRQIAFSKLSGSGTQSVRRRVE